MYLTLNKVVAVNRKNFVLIEYMLRKGERDVKQLAGMKSAHFAKVSHPK